MTDRQRSLPGFEEECEPVEASPTAADRPQGALAGQTVYIVDAHALIYQVFHAMPEMTGPNGQPVGAIYGFIRDVLDIVEKKRPNYFYCAFDHPGGETFRHEFYGDYKANRAAMPDDLRPQIPNIQRLLAALGVPTLCLENYEADDILATVARRAEEEGGQCFIVTNDKDCRQLISDRVQLYNIRKDHVFDADELMEDWGVRPDQAVDFQALVGDSVDNVPGVPLIGPKLARELLQKYDTLEGVLDHAGELSGKKRRENLINYRQQALLSRDLVRLVTDTPIEIDWQAGRVGGIDLGRTNELCQEFGFRRLADQIAQLTVQDAPVAWSVTYRTVTTADELVELAAEMSQQTRLAFDIITTSPSPRWAEIVGYSFAWHEGQAYYVPVRAPDGETQLDPNTTLATLRPIFEDAGIEKAGQDLKSSLAVLRSVDIALAGITCDTMVADYLLDPGQRNHHLDDIAQRYLNHSMTGIQVLVGTGKRQKRLDELPLSQVAGPAAEAADVVFRLARILEEKLAAEGLTQLFCELEMPLIDVLAELEFNGIKIDVARLRELSERFGNRIRDVKREIFELAGAEFNIDSRLQLSDVLFTQFGLPVVKRTKTGPSTDADVLAELGKQHALPAKIVEYRQFAKLKSTYVDALSGLVHPETQRVHTSFKQDVAATGRLSSTDPNLQNIPIRTPEGREIRSAFVPGPARWRLLTADYSQIELRVLAHYSHDEVLQRAFAQDRDIHALVASQVYGVSLDEVTSQLRRSAKAVNFGVIYGQSPFGLAKALEISQEDAAQFIDAYFAQYTGVENFVRKVLEECRRNGYVSTILGRRRAVHGIRDPSRIGTSRQRNLPERIAINTVIQGSAADLIKQAMINVSRRMRREQLQARMLLQIHDELVFEVPSDELTNLSTLVMEEMTGAGQLDVPMRVDIKVGTNWADCE